MGDLEHAYRRFAVVVLIVAIGSQTIFLIVAGVSWDSFIGVDLFDVCLDLLVFLQLTVHHWL